jgi:hypothetical protein
VCGRTYGVRADGGLREHSARSSLGKRLRGVCSGSSELTVIEAAPQEVPVRSSTVINLGWVVDHVVELLDDELVCGPYRLGCDPDDSDGGPINVEVKPGAAEALARWVDEYLPVTAWPDDRPEPEPPSPSRRAAMEVTRDR